MSGSARPGYPAVPVWAPIAGPYRTRCEGGTAVLYVYRCLWKARIEREGRLVLDWIVNPHLSPRMLPGIKEWAPGAEFE